MNEKHQSNAKNRCDMASEESPTPRSNCERRFTQLSIDVHHLSETTLKDLQSIQTKIQLIQKVLMGNGQPGLDEQVRHSSALVKENKHRIDRLCEKNDMGVWNWWTKVAAIVVMFSAIAAVVLQLISYIQGNG